MELLKTEPYRPLKVEVPAFSPEWVRKIEEAERRYDEAQRIELTPEEEREIEEMERRYEEDKLKQEKEAAKGSQRNPKKEPKVLGSRKVLALPLKAPRRSRRSA